MTYQPKPIPTKDVVLNKSLTELQELLARNNHDHWATARLAEGWIHGLQRDDNRKTHPGLVPYEALPESEKEYDRRTAMEAIRSILKLGYKLTLENGSLTGTGQEVSSSPGDTAQIIDLMKRSPVKLARLQQLWRNRIKAQWMIDPPVLYRTMGELACRIGEPFFAYDVVGEGLDIFPNDVKLLQLRAWALAQCGATQDAEKLLLSLSAEGQDATDTIGLLGRCYKDFGRMAPEPGQRAAYFRKSAEIYQKGFALTQASYLGLNAATLFLLIDETTLARQLAGQAMEACRKEMAASPEDVWLHATVAELALLLDESDAKSLYKKFRSVAGPDFGVIFSTRKQAGLVLEKKELPEDFLDECLRVPPVVVFAGHMIDSGARKTPRFPQSLEPVVQGQIKDAVKDLDAAIAFSSAACGSDILFLEAMLARDKEYHLVLPLLPELFRKLSVVKIGGESWGERFDKVLAGAASVTVANPQDKSLSPASLDFGNQLVYGMAKIRARTIGTTLKTMAVWNEKPGDGQGGTAISVKTWKSRGEDVLVLNPFPQSNCAPLIPGRPAAITRVDANETPPVSAGVRGCGPRHSRSSRWSPIPVDGWIPPGACASWRSCSHKPTAGLPAAPGRNRAPA